jgi:hypothetical protein
LASQALGLSAKQARWEASMTDIYRTPVTLHQPHTLVSWNAVFAGAAIAASVGAMLNLLGMALGAAALDPYHLTRGDAEGFTVGAGIWIAVANALALFVGGLIATRAAKHTDHHRGYLNGLVVWAVAFLFAILIATATATASSTAAPTIRNPASALHESAKLAEAVIPGTDRNPAIADAAPAVPAAARDEADKAAHSTSAASLWGFLTMLLGAIAAALGGRYGARKHDWEVKAGFGDAADLSTTT